MKYVPIQEAIIQVYGSDSEEWPVFFVRPMNMPREIRDLESALSIYGEENPCAEFDDRLPKFLKLVLIDHADDYSRKHLNRLQKFSEDPEFLRRHGKEFKEDLAQYGALPFSKFQEIDQLFDLLEQSDKEPAKPLPLHTSKPSIPSIW